MVSVAGQLLELSREDRFLTDQEVNRAIKAANQLHNECGPGWNVSGKIKTFADGTSATVKWAGGVALVGLGVAAAIYEAKNAKNGSGGKSTGTGSTGTAQAT